MSMERDLGDIRDINGKIAIWRDSGGDGESQVFYLAQGRGGDSTLALGELMSTPMVALASSVEMTWRGSMDSFYLGQEGSEIEFGVLHAEMGLRKMEVWRCSAPLRARRLKKNPEFNYHPKCVELKITHLTFSNDLILFIRGDTTSVSLSMECLKKFWDYSGLSINKSKSNVFMAGINRVDIEKIKVDTGFNLGTFPFRYLGIPMAALRLTIEQFNPLISRISENVSAWAGANLSYAGRSELIILQGVECFWLSILPILIGVRDKVISLCRNFLWGGKATSFKKPFVAWRDICRLKPEEGLGFLNLQAWNLALLSKSLWNLQSKKDSLRVKYGKKSGDGWDFQGPCQHSKPQPNELLKKPEEQGPVISKKLGFEATVYCIWQARNARIFEGKISQKSGIIRDIKIQRVISGNISVIAQTTVEGEATGQITTDAEAAATAVENRVEENSSLGRSSTQRIGKKPGWMKDYMVG
ncbi:hypothetical protein Acr_04g0004320 [Actinidia rufa]|uniref:Uncharacterized protein n=1 Tax=Actinidia rufa TaxID=165716 RepID=A0A7J0EGT3_9ERIC|nr:hypothetical protein Acr_04g0004320 [Actinidia rufa]